MAITTRRKRQNASAVGCPLPVSVLPQGSSDAFARAQIGWSYGGNTAPPPTGAAIEDRIMAGSQNAVTIRDITVGGFN